MTDDSGVDLRGANLKHADFTGARLTGADVSGDDLRTTILSQDQVNTMLGDMTTQLPLALVRPNRWSRESASP